MPSMSSCTLLVYYEILWDNLNPWSIVFDGGIHVDNDNTTYMYTPDHLKNLHQPTSLLPVFR